jgi:hypothetical protein
MQVVRLVKRALFRFYKICCLFKKVTILQVKPFVSLIRQKMSEAVYLNCAENKPSEGEK